MIAQESLRAVDAAREVAAQIERLRDTHRSRSAGARNEWFRAETGNGTAASWRSLASSSGDLFSTVKPPSAVPAQSNHRAVKRTRSSKHNPSIRGQQRQYHRPWFWSRRSAAAR